MFHGIPGFYRKRLLLLKSSDKKQKLYFSIKLGDMVMSKKNQPAENNSIQKKISLPAEPQPLEIDIKRTAVIVVDMQNAFVKEGGMFQRWGIDISANQTVIGPIQQIIGIARVRGCKVIYIAHRFSPDLREGGNPISVSGMRSVPMKYYREFPEMKDKTIIRGTWGAAIVDEIKPVEGDIVVEKPRYSAFFGTNLDIILRTYDLKYLLFTGVATNTCVEHSIRDAYNLEYLPILVSDATMNTGPAFVKEATLFNVKLNYGWVTTAEKVMEMLK
jgi:ureidoacrylate peracid hydrolase